MEDEILCSIKTITVYVNGLFPFYSHYFIAVGSCVFSFYSHNICFAPENIVIIITFYRFHSVEEKNNKHGTDSEQKPFVVFIAVMFNMMSYQYLKEHCAEEF